jgi:hypothetical protein
MAHNILHKPAIETQNAILYYHVSNNEITILLFVDYSVF